MNDLALQKVRLEVSGEKACFRRPEFSRDLVSYDVMPPTVARQLIKALLGNAGWELSRIITCRPIRFERETLTTARGSRQAIILMDVNYILEAIAPPGINRRDVNASVTAHLGLADYAADLRFLHDSEPIFSQLGGSGRIDLGWMIYDTDRSRSRFFRASMTDGVMPINPLDNWMIAT